MRNLAKKIYGIGLVIGLVFSSCDLDKFPQNGPTTGLFPATIKEAEYGLLGAYKAITLLDASSTPFIHVIDNITDVGYTRPGNNYTPGITSAYTTDNALATKPWGAHYKTIARVHTVLDNLTSLKGTVADATYNQIDAELRFIRAYAYSQLIELYGDVPLLEKAVTLGNTNVPQTPKSDIQQWIINEMTAIAEALPVSQSSVGHVRASRIAAYMLKARVALYSEQYAVAASAAKTAIDLSSGIHELTPFNASVAFAGQDHTSGEPDVTNIFGHEGFRSSKEWIWIMEYNRNIAGNVHNQQYYSASRLGRGVAYWGPTQDFIDSFQDIAGFPITESQLYDAQNPFANRDPRLDMYCVRPHSRFMGYQFEMNTAFPTIANYWPIINGTGTTPSSNANTDLTNSARSYSGYLWRKHVDIADFNTTSVNGESDLNVGVFRYAELLLIYAEAKIEANDIDASTYNAINAVRLRAKMPELPQNLSQTQLRKALRYERKIELANDGLRWHDIRRWEIGEDILNGYLYLNRAARPWTANVLTSLDENYTPQYNHAEAVKSFGTQNVVYKVRKDEYWPIPTAEITANPELEQNPGY
ncbi:RagB/SusD family nutrient uptake outer membrane protein [Sphingobacterium olei]|uniref:RagB/SusD family nutrient uptake outer membrane protein n=1 Tax=Sphingobacterium olei TaxID=2571155 RepID=A0A4V5MN11_9SPHI|nr:RagB/SusD family nutrient uptake outer membrane protein [Sphingobacterium olei]TJZ62938.1 RagB/SusD family nutrient uptake outer membrane protein [Sphingobacterium olei]